MASLDEVDFIQKLPKNIDVVFYFAKSRFYRGFLHKNYNVFNINVRALLLLPDYSLKIGIKKFVYLSSGGIYGVGKEVFSEEFKLNIDKNHGFYLS